MISLIVAMASDGLIGKEDALPWDLVQERRYFKSITFGHVVIMGRKTYESLPKQLEGRINIVVSKTLRPLPGIILCSSLEEALVKAKEYQKKVFIIGGASIYAQALPFVDHLYVSFVKGNYQGDIYFPGIIGKEWEVASSFEYPHFEARIYHRKATLITITKGFEAASQKM